MSFSCEWQALHGPLCSHQCDDCKDDDAHPRPAQGGATVSEYKRYIRAVFHDNVFVGYQGTNHPASANRAWVWCDDSGVPLTPRGVPAYHPTEAQPIRVGGPET